MELKNEKRVSNFLYLKMSFEVYLYFSRLIEESIPPMTISNFLSEREKIKIFLSHPQRFDINREVATSLVKCFYKGSDEDYNFYLFVKNKGKGEPQLKRESSPYIRGEKIYTEYECYAHDYLYEAFDDIFNFVSASLSFFVNLSSSVDDEKTRIGYHNLFTRKDISRSLDGSHFFENSKLNSEFIDFHQILIKIDEYLKKWESVLKEIAISLSLEFNFLKLITRDGATIKNNVEVPSYDFELLLKKISTLFNKMELLS